jgi:threonine aldolase
VCIETPVRRMRNALFPEALLAEVRAAARAVGAGLHLDGARLPIAAAAQGKPLREGWVKVSQLKDITPSAAPAP